MGRRHELLPDTVLAVIQKEGLELTSQEGTYAMEEEYEEQEVDQEGY